MSIIATDIDDRPLEHSLPLGPLLAQGRTAQVFAWNEGQILKLFRPERPHGEAEYEYQIARTVQDAGLDVPKVFGLLEVEGRRGIIYERIVGRSMLEELISSPAQLNSLARTFAQLHASIHDRSVPTLRSLREAIEQGLRNLSLPAGIRQELSRRFGGLADDDCLCHGDFHPGNIMLTGRGPVVIDWMNARRGTPLADVAYTSILLRVGALPPVDAGTRRRIESARREFHDAYLQEYERLRPGTNQAIASWQAPAAVLRLNDNIPEERQALLALIGV